MREGVITAEYATSKAIYLAFKRLFDIAVSLFSIIVLSPIMLVIAVAIKLESKGNVIYKHRRVGKNGKHFYVYKFRTMYNDSQERLAEMLKNPDILKEWQENYKLNNDPRITKVGKILRKLSIDELPQLFNILNGEMSIIGPRPVIDGEIEKYGKNKDKILSVRPGLTGWWACNGRSCTNYDERVKLETYYVDNMSILLDIKCIFKTVGVVLKGTGAK